ncbi:unnamed protein product [Caenorhabditis brenneri]
MSLSRPARIPLLKLPWLCIECVTRNCDAFDIIFFALTSKKTRRIVKSFNISLNGIRISVSEMSSIWLGGFSKVWFFIEPSLKSSFETNSREIPLMFRNNPIPLCTSRTNNALISYTHRNTMNALRMAMEFLNKVFKCSVERVNIGGDNFPESGDIGVKSTGNLCIDQRISPPFGYAQSQKIKLLLENLEVTGTCTFDVTNTEKDFYVDPKLIKCKKLMIPSGSAVWVTREMLLQYEVPRLTFFGRPISVEDILSFVTHWFHSDNKKFEYLHIGFRARQFSWEAFQDLNPLPFNERNRIPPSGSIGEIDFSKGLEIVRHDGLQATIHANNWRVLFYIWHDQSAITQS